MFERFTDRAQRVIVFAQEEARLLNHDYIGSEHILLGLIHEGEGVAAQALESLGISLEKVRRQVEDIIGAGESPQPRHVPFTPRAKTVLELSLREALKLGHNYIGTEHILLGLISEGDGVAARVLVDLGAELGAVRQQVIGLLSGSSPGRGGQGKRLSGRAEARAWATGSYAKPRAASPPMCPMCGDSLTEHLRVAVIEAGTDDATPGGSAPEGAANEGRHQVSIPYCGRCGHAV